jgi:uncharacterized protein YheU (UPF0270 family)
MNETMEDLLPGVEVPWQQLPAEPLMRMLEEFVTREGTDLSENELSLTDKVAQVRRQLERGEAAVVFDPATESFSLVSRRC